VDLTGHAFAIFVSPITGLRGVAYDRRARDGFWLCGQGDRNSVYKIQWSGTMTKVPLMTPLVEVRGLDHYVDPSGVDLIAMVGVNTNNVDVFNTWKASDGALQMSSGHAVGAGAFQAGYWGVRAVGPPDAMGGFDRWLSRSSGAIERWRTAGSNTATVNTMFGAIRGLDVAPDGTFWLVAGQKIIHANAQGAQMSSFVTPSTDPMGLSYQP
jgi:hypothetical protein